MGFFFLFLKSCETTARDCSNKKEVFILYWKKKNKQDKKLQARLLENLKTSHFKINFLLLD